MILLEIMLTGGLHCDGFMDTMDGIFSGRSRERILEIMKDSRVGGVWGDVFCVADACEVFVLFGYTVAMAADGFFCDAYCRALGRSGAPCTLSICPSLKDWGKVFGQYAGGLTVLGKLIIDVGFIGADGFAGGSGRL